MAIYQTAHYEVKPGAVEAVTRAIVEFIDYVGANEPGTELYASWQQQDQPTHFVHLFIFSDDAAHEALGGSAAVRRFEAVYRPELVGGPVVFTDYNLVSANRQ